MYPIAVDAMGGDFGPEVIIDGAVAAARECAIPVRLVGDADRLMAALRERGGPGGLVEIVPATDAIGMDEAPKAALKRPESSIRVAIADVAAGRSAAVFSAGNTGATVMAAHATLGMLKSVDRPALAATVPTRGHLAVLLDVGANARCRASHLVQFAEMGAVFARISLGIASPRVGLLSIGEEETKGNELTRETHRLLKAAALTFVGNIEARDVYAGAADVIVCDGFTGNIALKVSEGLAEMIGHALADGLQREAPAIAHDVFERLRQEVDYSEYGAAPLLGVAGLVLIGHGRSSAKAVRRAIQMAHRFASAGLLARLQHDIAVSGDTHR
jgi:phosphate acyltransferase